MSEKNVRKQMANVSKGRLGKLMFDTLTISKKPWRNSHRFGFGFFWLVFTIWRVGTVTFDCHSLQNQNKKPYTNACNLQAFNGAVLLSA